MPRRAGFRGRRSTCAAGFPRSSRRSLASIRDGRSRAGAIRRRAARRSANWVCCSSPIRLSICPARRTSGNASPRMLGKSRSVRLTEISGKAATLARVTAEFESGPVRRHSLRGACVLRCEHSPAKAASCWPTASSRAPRCRRCAACRRSWCSTPANPRDCAATARAGAAHAARRKHAARACSAT